MAWLRRRKDADGNPLIGAAEFAAGERFRSDYTRAGLMPRLTVNWDQPFSDGGPGGVGHMLDVAIDARKRVRGILDMLGPEMGHLVIDVCCHLKGLTEAEADRAWPRRSAKIVLDMALRQLARHYGYGDHVAPSRRNGTRHWAEDGYRPTIDGDDIAD